MATIDHVIIKVNDVEASLAFYTGVLGSSALAPVLYGRLGDIVGPVWDCSAAAITALAVVPLILLLASRVALSSKARDS